MKDLKMRSCRLGLIAALVVGALIGLPAVSEAKMRKQYVELTVPADETVSTSVALDYSGTIKLCRIDTPATCTLTLTAYNGDAGTMTLATATVSSTGVSSASGLATVPVANEVRLSATVGSSTGSARTIKLVVLIEE